MFYCLNILVIFVSVIICSMLMLFSFPGTELLGIAPHWLLIWIVAFSVKRSTWDGAIAGIVLGLIYDAMVGSSVSHIFGLTIVGVVTASLNKQKYLREDFIFIALIVFILTVMTETITAFQYSLEGVRSLGTIWQEYPRISLISATITSLWAPIVYFPLDRWWSLLEKKRKT